MSIWSSSFINTELSKRTSIFGLRLYVVIGIVTGAFIVLLLFLLSLCLTARRKSKPSPNPNPKAVKHRHQKQNHQPPVFQTLTPPLSKEILEIDPSQKQIELENVVQIDVERGENRVERSGGPPQVSHLGWGHWYTLRELEEATGGLAEENVIGEGGYGIVYRGVLADRTMVAIKNLLNNRGQAEKEFKVEVEAIGRVRHKHLVRLLGYCVEGEYRMLVYEYVDNGNLEQWLHGDVGDVSPLTWEIRMNIILGTAKGLAYLHEGLEPKVVHRDVKASNILLDRQWYPKISDFGLAKHLGSERTYVTTRVMGTFGYVAPEYASTGMLNERSDVYSFGILIMEIISGRTPVDYRRPPAEVHLVEWLKTMVGERKAEEVVDPKMPIKPSSKVLKRALLVALRCVDPDSHKRPKMGNVIHMLEMDDLLFRDDHKVGQQASSSHRSYLNNKHLLARYENSEDGGFHRSDTSSNRR
ncbi:uncharacterized protein A4U43_C01F16270 [Asparagus officinalis]|uniref:non-specific serine/threonine protein kinase n=1 Tax=Asparagus officinalis TaxID=4686 RepID=A0A5P1FQD5_ASPOF|nr:probable serine/threonine-protein kinase At1g01540 [Asparagus officinalis]ONK80312.1 uncharacterized protein A4U43_C01F16270 [Asparagus officinalis]